MHLAAAIICVALGLMLVRGIRGWARVSLAIFAASAVSLLTVSGLFHIWGIGAGRDLLRRADHAAIFVLIAGTFTPIHAILFRGPKRWVMLYLIWTIAVVGSVLKLLWFDSFNPVIGIIIYIIMGWLGSFAFVMLARREGIAYIRPLLLGGIAYTMGAVVEAVNWPTIWPRVIRPHEIFHVMVLLGLWGHWHFIAGIARGLRMTERPSPQAPILAAETSM